MGGGAIAGEKGGSDNVIIGAGILQQPVVQGLARIHYAASVGSFIATR